MTSLAVLFALVVPLIGTATANHPGGSTLEVSAETSENSVGTQHTLTARLFQDTSETPVTATGTTGPIRIHFEVEGGPAGTVVTEENSDGSTGAAGRTYQPDVSPTSPDMHCRLLSGDSECTVTFFGGAAGANLVRAWIDHDQLSGTFDGDGAEGRFAGGPNVPGKTYPTDCRNAVATGTEDTSCARTGLTPVPGAAEPDTTDVVSKTWIAPSAARCIDAEPETDTNASGTDHVIRAQVTNNDTNAPGNDVATSFNCQGSAVSGASVRIERTAGPAVTIDGVATSVATKSTGTVDADGANVSFTVRCVDPNCTGTNTFNLTVLGAPTGSQAVAGDSVDKTWGAPGVAADFRVFPERDTNAVGTTHTLTCRVRDAGEQGIAAQNCDFQVISDTGTGNAARDIDNNAGTNPGFIGQCFTAADGTCSVSYSSTAQGTDTIRGWRDINGNNVFDEPDNDLHRRIVFKTWVALGFAPSQVRLDMGDTATTDRLADCSVQDLSALANPVNTNHQICAQAQDQFGTATPAPITFTIVSGPGFFTDGPGTTVNRGSTITIQAAADGDALAFLRSAQSGTTTVQACIEGTTTCSSNGTKPWTGLNARNIALTPETDTNEPGTNHQLTATARDRLGNPVAGATVTFSISGVGTFVSRESTTDANGNAFATITSNQEGTSTVTVTITDDDPATMGNQTTECTRAAGDPAGAPAGNCSDTASKTWEEEPDDGVLVNCAGHQVPEGGSLDVDGDGDPDVFAGTTGADTITGTGEGDIICGRGGDDTIAGLGGGDDIRGGGGSDTIAGGGGSDSLRGNRGADSIGGGGGADTIRGGGGPDTVRGGGRGDTIFGGGGSDTLRGNRGADTINGGRGGDTLLGGPGNDVLRGGPGRDTLRGGRGDDLLNGGPGRRDFCAGGPGRDILRNCERRRR